VPPDVRAVDARAELAVKPRRDHPKEVVAILQQPMPGHIVLVTRPVKQVLGIREQSGHVRRPL
jgi:hypothetical protein